MPSWGFSKVKTLDASKIRHMLCESITQCNKAIERAEGFGNTLEVIHIQGKLEALDEIHNELSDQCIDKYAYGVE